MSRSKWKHRAPQIKAAKRDEPKEFRISASIGTATIQAAEGDGEAKKLGRFEGLAYTGAPMRPEGWWNPIIVDLDGVRISNQHRPVLRQHDHEQLVGHTDSVKVTKDGITMAGVFSGQQEHVDKVTVPAKNGFQWQLSIGANPIRREYLDSGKTTTVNGREVTGPLEISRETELGEISFVPLGADGDTSATVQASNRKGNAVNPKQALKFACSLMKAAKYSDDEVDAMSDEDAKAALKKCMSADADPKEPDEDDKDKKKADASRQQRIQADNKAYADNALRIDGIRATANKYNVQEIEIDAPDGKKQKVNLVAHAITNNWTDREVDVHARLAALEKLQASRPGPGVGVPGGLAYSTNAPQITAEVLECAVIQAGRHEFKLEDDSFYMDEYGRRRIPEGKQREIQGGMKQRYPDQVQQAAHTLFRGQSGLQQIIVAGARCFGYAGSDRITDGNLEEVLRFATGHAGHAAGMGIRASDGASTASIANILANVQNKFALMGYLYVEQAWREIAAIRPTTDFKPTKSINLLGDTMVKPIPDDGQIEHATLSDQAFANQVDQYGRMLTIGRKPMVNDDLSILTTAPTKMGQGAGLGLNNLFWTVFGYLGSLTADDGAAFWANTGGKHTATAPVHQVAANANLLTAGASTVLSSTSLATAKAMFDNQIDPNGNPMGFDSLVPVLLFPSELWQTAMELVDPAAIGLVYGGSTATKQPNVNLWKGRLKPVMSRYLNKTLTDTIAGTSRTVTGSTTAWYNLYAPVAGSSVMEVAFLNGSDAPVVQTAGPDWNFDRLGISMRVIFDYGVNAQNFRAGVKSPGA